LLSARKRRCSNRRYIYSIKEGLTAVKGMLRAISFENIEYYTFRGAWGLEPFSSGPLMIAGTDRNGGLDARPGYAEVK
jgi:hypothetical protein